MGLHTRFPISRCISIISASIIIEQWVCLGGRVVFSGDSDSIQEFGRVEQQQRDPGMHDKEIHIVLLLELYMHCDHECIDVINARTHKILHSTHQAHNIESQSILRLKLAVSPF